MKDMDKYNEALERAKAAYGTGAYDDATLEFLFPQLCESEDERIRKFLIEILSHGTWRTEWPFEPNEVVAYLEKQKENPKSADSIPSDCTSDVKYEDRWHKVANSLPDNGRDVLAKDALGNFLLASFDGDRWYISGYDNEDKPIVYTPAIEEWCDIPSEKQKEQKPAELTPLATLLSNYLKNDFEYFAKKKWDETRWNETLNIQASELLRYAKKELEKDQKPSEWSEEDEKMIKSILFVLESFVSHSESASSPSLITTYPTYHEEIDWLKSFRPKSKDEIYKEKVEAFKLGKHSLAARFENYLDENRPEGKMFLSIEECDDIDKAFEENNWEKIMRYANKYAWKPSEWQMHCLEEVIDNVRNGVRPFCSEIVFLEELRDELKKL